MSPSAVRFALLLAAVLAPLAEAATTVEVESDFGIGRSDNVGRTAQDPQDATLKSLGLRFSVLHDTRRIDVDMVGDLALTDYEGNVYSTELTGNAAGRLSFNLLEERLRWTVEDSFGQTRRDPFVRPTPENREKLNFFSTGPDFRQRLGSSMSLLLGGRYTRVDYEFSPADSERIGGWIAAERELSSTARLGFYVAGEQIDPRGDSLTPTYERNAAYLRYALTGSRTSAAIDIGGNRVQGDGIEDSGSLVRIELSRSLGRFSRLTFNVGQELTDSGNSLRLPPGGQLPTSSVGTESLIQTAEPYTQQFAEIAWAITGRRTGLNISAGWFDEDYQQASQPDRKRLVSGLRASRLLGARMEMVLGAQYNRHDFETFGGDNDELNYNATFTSQLSRRFRLEAAAERYQFSSDFLGGSSDETRYWLRVRFGDRLTRNPSPGLAQ